jgi:CRP/FNR family transcriptional regulator
MNGNWTTRFEGLSKLEPDARSALDAAARIVKIPAGTQIFAPGQTPQGYVLIVSGDIRVSQVSESGREIVLYRVLPGDSCTLTTACLLGGDDYQAEAVAETDIEAVVIPRLAFEGLIGTSPSFRRFVFASFSNRVSDILKLVDVIAFQRLDVRLASKLVNLTGPSDELDITHQQLATELGTAREVVSRQLNEFQRRGWISATRGSLKLMDRKALAQLAKD